MKTTVTRGALIEVVAPTPVVLAFLDWQRRETMTPAQMLSVGPMRNKPGASYHRAFWADGDLWRVEDWIAAHVRPGRKYPKGARYTDGVDVFEVAEDGPDRCGQVLCADGICRTPKGWRKLRGRS